MANPQIIVEYIAKVDQLNKANQAVSAQGGKVGGALKKGLVPAVAVLGTLSVAMGASVKAASEAEVASKRLDAVFKAQGETTNAASQAAQDYASSLSAKIGVDDEVIMQGQAIIATFRGVSDETARQSGVFDRTTAAAADLAAAGFGSLEGNAGALAKALNDPAKGLAKLTRQGVSFTASEEKRIKSLQASGKFTEAQKVLLEAVEKQVGGTAAATATESQKMQVAYGELQEEMGGALLPAFKTLTAAGTRLAAFFQRHPTLLKAVIIGIGALAAAVILANAAIAVYTAVTTIAGAVTMAWLLPVLIVIGALAALVAIGILVWKKWDVISAALSKAFEKIKAAAVAVINWLKSNWPKIVAIMAGPIGIAVLLIVKHVDKIKAAFTAVWNFLKGMASKMKAAATAIADAIKGPINAIIGAWNSLRIPGFSLDINMPGPVPDIGFDWGGFDFPNIPKLAAGGIVTRPTLAMVGEAGPEAVMPLSGLGGAIEVRVFIGDTELRGIVQSEVVRNNSATARMLMAGTS